MIVSDDKRLLFRSHGCSRGLSDAALSEICDAAELVRFDSEHIFLDVDASLDPVSASLLVEFSEQVIWCPGAKKVESSVYRLKAIEARAPGWRDKINLVWTLENDAWVAPRD